MANQVSTLSVKYMIASADMYYSEEEQREICVYDDPEQGPRIWGEDLTGEKTISIDLCQIFLEYSLFCQMLHSTKQSYEEMRSFGENLGARLADYIKAMPLLHDTPNRGACALETILGATHAHVTIEHIGPEMRFVVAGCPLLDASKHTGLTEVELAQFGFNMMCQSVVQGIDPGLILNVPIGNDEGQVFTLIKPTPLAHEPSYSTDGWFREP